MSSDISNRPAEKSRKRALNAEKQRRYRQRHPDRVAEEGRRWRAANVEHVAEYKRTYRQSHRLHVAASDRGRHDPLCATPSKLTKKVTDLMLDPEAYVNQALRIRLRPYQAEPLKRILDSIEKHLGDSFVIIFPRQSGKDEFLLDLMLYLADLYSVLPVGIVTVNPTYCPQTENAMQRFDRLLQADILTRGQWRNYGGHMRILGEMHVAFLSGDKKASVAGATASLLLIINEAQDISPRVYSQKFEPMAASTNATRIFAGTAWTSRTLLAEEKRAALEAERQDGRKRVFSVDADEVSRCVPWYGRHVEAVVRKQGRQHPMVKTQYFNEEIDEQGSMFNAGRRALMRGDQVSALSGQAVSGRVYAFCIDVAGMDEANRGYAEMNKDGLGNPGRDSTTLSIAEIDLSTLATLQAPTFRIVHREQWTGLNHLTVCGKLEALGDVWRPQHIVIDATGVGEGLWDLLDKDFPTKVIPVKFSAQKKSDIGYRFLAMIETGRFRDATGTAVRAGRGDHELTGAGHGDHAPTGAGHGDHELTGAGHGDHAPTGADTQVRPYANTNITSIQVDKQYTACISEILPGPQKTMRWGVPDGTRDENGELIHDDIVVADSLVTELDALDWSIHSPTLIVSAIDPLEEMSCIR